MIGRLLKLLLVFAFLGALLTAVLIGIGPYPARSVAAGNAIPGIWHVHAEKSHDGHGTLTEAVIAARDMGAAFMVMTEHEVIRPDRPERMEGVLVIPGAELSAQAGHVIEVGLTKLPETRGPDVLGAIAAAGGEAVLAHPINAKKPWTDPSPDGFVGFEALSLDSAFRDASPLRLLLAGLSVVGDSRKAGAILMDRPAKALARYDELTLRRPVTLFCGVDAHGLPPYPASFGALRLFVDLGPARTAFGKDAAADADAILRAFREGRTFCSVPALGDASSFSLRPIAGAIQAKIEAADATLVLFQDGKEVLRVEGQQAVLDPAMPGSYRAEVWLKTGFPYRTPSLWIVSSALRIEK